MFFFFNNSTPWFIKASLFIQEKKIKYIINLKYIFSGKRLLKHLTVSLIIVMTYIITYIICAYSLNLKIDLIKLFCIRSDCINLYDTTCKYWRVGRERDDRISHIIFLGLSVSSSVTVAIVYGICNLVCSLPGIYFLITSKAVKS